MDRKALSDIILNAPGWARIGLTMPDPAMRERAADTLAATILDRLEPHGPEPDPDQLALPL